MLRPDAQAGDVRQPTFHFESREPHRPDPWQRVERELARLAQPPDLPWADLQALRKLRDGVGEGLWRHGATTLRCCSLKASRWTRPVLRR